MKHKLVTVTLILFFLTFALFAQDFTRGTDIAVPETDLNNGGWGNMISGVDVDGDGNLEIYLVNDNWNDGATEVIPRIYKLEQNGENWDVVWSAVGPVAYQNTWPQLALADLDKDGKQELVWTPINAGSANPFRILVYEHAGDDVFGIATADTNLSSGEDLKYAPNSSWTIVDDDGMNLRPMDITIADPDGDGVDELLIAERAGNTDGHYFLVCSVDDIPDNGDGSESWEIEVSGLDFNLIAPNNKWDVALVGSNSYFFDEDEISKLSWDGADWNYTALSKMTGGSFNQTSQVVDLDNDGTKEIIGAIYDWGDDNHKAFMLLQEEGDTLKHTELININAFWPSGSRGGWGSAVGDIDGDGYLDYVFGSRASTPNAGIFRVAYRGGDITDPANYEFSIIDSLAGEGGIWSIVNLANIDDDPELEILYTSSSPTGGLGGGSPAIIVLDYTGSTGVEFDNLIVASEVLLDGATPEGVNFRPGRILDDDANTIWFSGRKSQLGSNVTYAFRSIDGGATFTHNETAIPGRVAQLDAWDADVAILATAEGAIHRTTDGGATWTEVYSYTIDGNPGFFDGCRVLNDNVAVVFGDTETNGEMHFVRTTDKGATWTQIEGIDFLGAAYGYYTHGGGASNVGESFWGIATTTAYDSSYIFRSYDAGETWEGFKIPIDVIATYPRNVAFVDDNNGLIADRRGNVVKTTDGGETWMATNKPDTSSSSWANGLTVIPNTNIIVAMDDIGVYYTTNLGATWGEITTPPEADGDYMINGVFLNTGFGFVFTDNGLVFRFENQVTAIPDAHATGMPADFQLHQNFPNPFNPTTHIAFSMPHAADVKVVIYDMLGRKVRSVFEGHKNAGTHFLTWNGQNDAGQSVSSGVYIYTLTGNDVNISKKMQLIR